MGKQVSIVGTGLVGRAWATVFARAGYRVVLFDPVDGVAAQAKSLIAAALPDLAANDLLNGREPDTVMANIDTAPTLAQALADSFYVQESGPEKLDVKQALFQELDKLAPAEATLASSTSGFPASTFTDGLAGRHRCLVAHPINPPHIVPLVEIVPAPWTAEDIVDSTRALMAEVGQSPISTTREINGFIVNRLQGALLSEAFRLVEDGVCSITDVDAAIADGLGLRWSFMGPFETIDLNSPGGIAGYCRSFGDLYYTLGKEQADPRRWSAALIEDLERQRRALLPMADNAARQAWRDQRLAQLVRHKKQRQREEGDAS